MTNEQLFEDLKQFIAATVTQQTSDIKGDIAEVKNDVSTMKGDITEVKHDITAMKSTLIRLERKIDDGFASASAVVETINTRVDDLEDETDKLDARLTLLEHRTA